MAAGHVGPLGTKLWMLTLASSVQLPWLLRLVLPPLIAVELIVSLAAKAVMVSGTLLCVQGRERRLSRLVP